MRKPDVVCGRCRKIGAWPDTKTRPARLINGGPPIADCPKRDARLHDRCDLVCPDLPKVL